MANRPRDDSNTPEIADALSRLRRARDLLDTAQAQYSNALYSAVSAGATRRATAEAAGLSLSALQRCIDRRAERGSR